MGDNLVIGGEYYDISRLEITFDSDAVHIEVIIDDYGASFDLTPDEVEQLIDKLKMYTRQAEAEDAA